MDKVLRNKVAFIIGDSGGVGRATAVLFAEAGARVAVAGHDGESGRKTVELVREAGGEGLFIPTATGSAEAVEAAVQAAVRAFGKIDIAFNNADASAQLLPIAQDSEENFERVFETNVRGVWLALKYEIRQMLKQGGGGSIINNSSVYGSRGAYLNAHYVASKHAVEGYTRAAALEVAAPGIRVNAIAPGFVHDTPPHRRWGADIEEYLIGSQPLGRAAEPAEPARAVLFLASDAASFITGASLPVDGGFLAR